MKKKIIAGAGVVIILAAAAAAFYLGNSGSGSGGGRGGMGGQDSQITVVKAAVPTKGSLSVTSSLTGTVEASDVVYVYAKESGDVTEVLVQAGDHVEAGDILLNIDTEQVDSARNSMDSALVNMEEAQSNLDRMTILHNSGDLSDSDYEQYENALKTATLQFESARISHDQAVTHSVIMASISGRIESFDVDVYDRVSQNEQLCVISGEGDSKVTFYVSQRMLNNISVGDPIWVEKNGKTYDGEVIELSTMVDGDSGLFKVKAQMDGGDEIAIGTTVKLKIVTDRTSDAMLVPINAVYYSGGDAFVYLYQDGKAEMVGVEVGLYDEEYAEILSGITEQDLVVSTWSSNLYEGADIRLADEAADGTEGQQQNGQPPEAAEQEPAQQ